MHTAAQNIRALDQQRCDIHHHKPGDETAEHRGICEFDRTVLARNQGSDFKNALVKVLYDSLADSSSHIKGINISELDVINHEVLQNYYAKVG